MRPAGWCGSPRAAGEPTGPRPTLRALARQYRDYGRWRRVVARSTRGTINARYLAPPAVLVVGVVAGAVGGFFWWPLWLVPAAYLAATTLGGLTRARAAARAADRLWLPAILPTMHLSLGLGLPHQPPAPSSPVGPGRPCRRTLQQQETPRAH